ncbi:MAG: molecular chaperone DnaJ [Leptolyngbya foveolarum]|uniref:Molecular chaperone DnaJ n=1 Tax=Leptolyngbya foveolarum TaxID=47253 RepID=A0A2W4UNU1_9CYAN|nr:MAG: molecular chaperone DnaJ [Leptolyngbya foveolarum]
MHNFRDYYEILGIAKEADASEIKRAYRALARRYHPDLNPGDKAAEEKFKLLGEAYDVLSDVEKRQQYEDYSQYWKQEGFKKAQRSGKSWRSGGRVSVQEEYSAFEDFDNFVEQLLKRHMDGGDSTPRQSPLRQSPSRPAPKPPASQPNLTPSPPSENDWTSRRAKRSVDNWGEVESPAASAETARTEARDNPVEWSRSRQQSTYARQPSPTSRRDAEADLTVPLEKAYAGGRERISLEDGRSLEVNMPAGMVTGQRIRLKGQGIGGGNLYLRIEVAPHPYFTLNEGDVYCRLPITPSEAVLGGTVAVPTLAGLVNMLIPPGVQAGQRLRLSSKGYPVGPGLYGDQIVELELVVPTVLDDEEKALYQELRSLERFDPRANLPV